MRRNVSALSLKLNKLNGSSQLRDNPPLHSPGKRASCMVHNLLNIDYLGIQKTKDHYDTDGITTAVSALEYETLVDESDHMSKDSLAEMVVSIRDLSRSLSKCATKVARDKRNWQNKGANIGHR